MFRKPSKQSICYDDTHSHAQASCTIPSHSSAPLKTVGTSTGPSADAATGSEVTRFGFGGKLIDTGHTHTDAIVDVDTNASVWPVYRDMIYCQSPDLEIDSGLIALFDDTLPSGWTDFSALDRRFPRGASTYGAQNNANTHTHTTIPSKTAPLKPMGSTTGPSADSADHKPPFPNFHKLGLEMVGRESSLSLMDMIFASKDSDGYGVADSIYIVSVIPPLGYSRFSDLDDVAFLRNAYASLQKQQTGTR